MESQNVTDLTNEEAWDQAREEKYKKREKRRLREVYSSADDKNFEEDILADGFVTKSKEIVKVNLTGLGDVCLEEETAILDRNNKLYLCPNGAGERREKSQMDLNSKSPEDESKQEFYQVKDEYMDCKPETSFFAKFYPKYSVSWVKSEEDLIRSLQLCPWTVIFVKSATILFDTTRMSPSLTIGSIEEEEQKERMRIEDVRRAACRPIVRSRPLRIPNRAYRATQSALMSPVPPVSSPSSSTSLSTDTDTLYLSEVSEGKPRSFGKMSDSADTDSSEMIIEPGFVVIQGDFRPESVPPPRFGEVYSNTSNNAVNHEYTSEEIAKVNLTGLGDVCLEEETAILDRNNKLYLCPNGAGERREKSQMDLNSKSPEDESKQEFYQVKDEYMDCKPETSFFAKFYPKYSVSWVKSEEDLIRSLQLCPWTVIFVKSATILFDTTRMSPSLTIGSIEEEEQKERMRIEDVRRAACRPIVRSRPLRIPNRAYRATQSALMSPVPPVSSPSSSTSLSTDTDTLYLSEVSEGKPRSFGKMSDSADTDSSEMIIEPGFVVIQGDFRPESVPPPRFGEVYSNTSNNAVNHEYTSEEIAKVRFYSPLLQSFVTEKSQRQEDGENLVLSLLP